MKKVLSFIIMIVLCTWALSACQITYPDSKLDSYFEQTVELLVDGDVKSAKSLNGVVKGDALEEQLQTAMEYLAGRKVTAYKKTSSEITNQNRSNGPITQETATYEVTMDDGTVLTFHTVYSDGMGVKGLTSFELLPN